MKIIITGVAGMIGSYLAERFIAGGHKVIGVDNFVTGSAENFAHLDSESFSFIEADVIQGGFEPGYPVDGILHFASPASPDDFERIPFKIMDVNSIGTRNCLELARKYNARFLMASTSEVYGDPDKHPQSESYFGNVNTRGPRSVYDESKRFAESMIDAYRRVYGLDVRIVRIFNTYGPRMRPDDGRVIPNFISQVLKGEPLTVYGDGSQTRSFCYVTDQAEGIYRLFNSDYTSPMNVGNPDEYTILELAGILQKLSGKTSEITLKPLPAMDPKRRCPDITLARKILGWSPGVSLEEGLMKTFRWFKEKLA